MIVAQFHKKKQDVQNKNKTKWNVFFFPPVSQGLYICMCYVSGWKYCISTDCSLTRIQNLALHHNSLHLIFTTQVIVHPASPN